MVAYKSNIHVKIKLNYLIFLIGLLLAYFNRAQNKYNLDMGLILTPK